MEVKCSAVEHLRLRNSALFVRSVEGARLLHGVPKAARYRPVPRLAVPRVGFEPTSSVLQTDAITRFANRAILRARSRPRSLHRRQLFTFHRPAVAVSGESAMSLGPWTVDTRAPQKRSVRDEGFEPSLHGSEPCVLPLDEPRSSAVEESRTLTSPLKRRVRYQLRHDGGQIAGVRFNCITCS